MRHRYEVVHRGPFNVELSPEVYASSELLVACCHHFNAREMLAPEKLTDDMKSWKCLKNAVNAGRVILPLHCSICLFLPYLAHYEKREPSTPR